jgi:hypothetical protein
MKYISNGKEVTEEEFKSLVGEQFKWFQNDTVNATSVSNLLDGDFKSQFNNHIKGVLEKDDVINSVNRGEKEMMEHFNKSNFFDKKEREQEILDTFKRGTDKIEGVKESQSVKKAPIFTYCKQMKNAIEQLAFRSEYGHNKYLEFDADWQNFSRVKNGDEEYGNAQFRHALGIGEDTELEHYVASAWDAVARLEIYLRNK